jgi:hypothetical protein
MRRDLALKRCVERAGNRVRGWLGRPRHPEAKIHGLLRAGTNYLEALVRRNFYVDCLAPWEAGWKNGPCEYVPERRYLFLVKHPYAWLVSFRNWERLHNRTDAASLAEFAARPLTHERLSRAWDISTPVQAWNRTLASWQAHDGKANTLFVRYEDLIRDVDGDLHRIRDHFRLRTRGARFVDADSRADMWKRPNPRKAFDVAYYRHEKYLDEFDEHALAIVRAELDPHLLARFDYRAH